MSEAVPLQAVPPPPAVQPGQAPAAPAQEKRTRPPLNAEQRAAAAGRARKSRALKKLKEAKGEDQLREAAAKIASGEQEKPPPVWPTKEEFQAAVQQLSPLLEAAHGFLESTPFEVSEKECQVLGLGLAPAFAAAAKDPGANPLLKAIDPTWVAVAALALVFAPKVVTFGLTLAKPAPPKEPTT